MSSIDYFDNEPPLLKNDILMSDINPYSNEFLPLKEEEKSISEESNFQNFIKRELFLKDLNSKNILSENDDDDFDDYSRRYEISTCRKAFSSSLSPNFFPKFDISNNPSDANTQLDQNNQNNTLSPQNKSSKKIFNIIKVPKNKQQIFQCLQKKRVPFDFNKCFDMIKKHIGDKTVQNYDKGKSFHIIKINNEERIVTLKDKKILLKQNKNKKKGINNLENNDKNTKYQNKDEKSNCSTNSSNNNTTGNNGEKSDEKTEKKDENEINTQT